MRTLMGLIRDRHGTYYARKKVPKGLEEVIARVLGNGRRRQAWLKKSLRTKSLRDANILAKPVLVDFDDFLESARELLKERPMRATLTRAQIAKLAEFYYATVLGNDAAVRRNARELRASYAADPAGHGVADAQIDGLTEEEFDRIGSGIAEELQAARNALARSRIDFVEGEVHELLEMSQIKLDPTSSAYRQLANAVLAEHVKAMLVRQQRHVGEPIETPRQPELDEGGARTEGDTLGAAFAGWQKERRPAAGTLTEYRRAIDLFIQLHGDIPVAQIKRSHARAFREDLQQVPRQRSGELLKASLPLLAQWGKEHPTVTKISPGTINKILGGVQAIVVWARNKGGMIPDDLPWSDPFASMRLREDEPGREPFTAAELKSVFASPVFTQGERPRGGGGEVAFWLPLLALFTGARRGELAGLTVADALKDETTGHPAIVLTEDESRSKSLKTPGSARTIPLHPELIRLGFVQFVDEVRRAEGETAWLFPQIAPERKGGASAWSKWFSRYIRSHGVKNVNKVFHSLRHNFKDALRAAKVSEDLNDALTGHSTRGSVGRSYGSRDIVIRYGMPTLIDAISGIRYTGLDLSSVKQDRKRTTKRN